MRRNDRGQGSVTALGLLILVLMVVGLAIDTTRAIIVRRNLQAACDAAALSGASMVNQARLRATRGRSPELDPIQAEAEARRIFALQAPSGATGVARATTTSVEVSGRARVSPTLLALAGLGAFDIPAHCAARPRGP